MKESIAEKESELSLEFEEQLQALTREVEEAEARRKQAEDEAAAAKAALDSVQSEQLRVSDR